MPLSEKCITCIYIYRQHSHTKNGSTFFILFEKKSIYKDVFRIFKDTCNEMYWVSMVVIIKVTKVTMFIKSLKHKTTKYTNN